MCEALLILDRAKGGKDEIDSMKAKIAAAQELYKKYAQLLPVGLRTRSVFSKKYCVEDDEMILFLVGNTVYRFDKIQAKQFGIVSPVRKLINLGK